MISVLLSVYNGDRWLAECIESILNQSFKDFEFLIIDDGSKDKSLSIIKKFAKKDPRIIYFSHANIGLTASLNKGLLVAKGEWVARIDSDDFACKERLEKQIIYAKKYKLALVGCQSYSINSEGKIENFLSIPNDHNKLCSNLKRQKIMFKHSSVLFKKKLVLELGGYRECMLKSQDYDLWLRISEKSKIGCICYIGTHIRVHSNNISFNDGGNKQRIFAHCANISHLIRVKYGKKFDPLLSSESSLNTVFIEFVKNKLIISRTILFYEFLFKLKKQTKGKNKFSKLISLFIYFNKPDLLIKLIKWKTTGDFISQKLAKDWLRYKNYDDLFDI